jgi:DNA-binding CsgD family transcriptional regulator
MGGLAKSVGAATATLVYADKTCSSGPITDVEFGFPAAQIRSYQDYFRTVDCRLAEIQKIPAGGILADDYNFDFEQFVQTEIYQDYWKPWGLGRALAGVIFKDTLRISLASIRRHADCGSFSEADVKVFERILRHVQRSFHLQNQLNRACVKATALAFALDQFPVALFLLNRHCVVLDHNCAAGALLADTHTSFKVRNQKLVACRSGEDQELQEAVRLAADSLHDIKAIPHFLRFPLLDGVRVLTLTAVPVPVMPMTRPLFGGPSDFVLLFCRETATSFVDPLRLRRQFGFSPAESKLAAAIAEGTTLEEFSVKRGVSVTTVRAQLKSAMSKADVHTQAQLASTVLRSLAALVCGK